MTRDTNNNKRIINLDDKDNVLLKLILLKYNSPKLVLSKSVTIEYI